MPPRRGSHLKDTLAHPPLWIASAGLAAGLSSFWVDFPLAHTILALGGISLPCAAIPLAFLYRKREERRIDAWLTARERERRGARLTRRRPRPGE